MSNWAGLADVLFTSVQSTYGDTVTYSRPASTQFSAVSAFSLSAVINTSGEFESPTGPLYGEALVRIADIALGPQKGDQLVWNSKTLRVQEVFNDFQTGHARLKLRVIS
jgi:hypothetical protein